MRYLLLRITPEYAHGMTGALDVCRVEGVMSDLQMSLKIESLPIAMEFLF
jgi:hypothetical protein